MHQPTLRIFRLGLWPTDKHWENPLARSLSGFTVDNEIEGRNNGSNMLGHDWIF